MITRGFKALILLLFILAVTGCVEQPHPPEPQVYVFEYTPYNSTTYYVSEDSVKTVHVVHNTSVLEIVPQSIYASAGSNFGFSNIVAVDRLNTSKTYSYNLTPRRIRGRIHVFIEFPPDVDFVAYTEKSEGNEIARIVEGTGVIRVHLPQNYTTGSPFLGMPRPNPDRMYEDASGRLTLEWNASNVTGGFSVKYYKKSAPLVLTVFFTILATAALIILTYFWLKIQALRRKREETDKQR